MSEYFNNQARDWDANEMVARLTAAVGAAIREQIPLHEQVEVMDFGAGTGRLSAHIAPWVKKIVAVDTSEAMLEKLAAKPELQGKVETVLQDITRQPLEARFDLVISAMAMHHVEDTSRLIRSLSQHLKPGGRIALADLDKEDGTFHPADVPGVYHHGFERDALQALAEEHGFEDVSFVTAHTVDKEGKQYPIFLLTAVFGG